MVVTNDTREIIREVLQIGERADDLVEDSALLGNIPELDSMAVALLVTTLEQYFDFLVDDDEISAETFDTFGSLCSFIVEKLSAVH